MPAPQAITQIELPKQQVADCLYQAIRLFDRAAKNSVDNQIAKIHKDNADRLRKAITTLTEVK